MPATSDEREALFTENSKSWKRHRLEVGIDGMYVCAYQVPVESERRMRQMIRYILNDRFHYSFEPSNEAARSTSNRIEVNEA
jgi:hypothetical protein